jgi:hypothetical protein
MAEFEKASDMLNFIKREKREEQKELAHMETKPKRHKELRG